MLRVLLTIGFLQGVAMAIFLLRTKALALLLGPEGVGALAVVDKLLAVVAQTVSLSLPYAAVRFLPGLWEQAPGACVALLRRMLALLLVLSLAAALFGVGVTLAYPRAWGADLLPYRPVLFLAFLTLPVVVLVPFLENAIAARLRPNHSMLFVVLHALVFMLAGVLGAWWGGLKGMYALYAVLGLVLVVPVLRLVTRAPERAPAAPPAGERTYLGLPRSIWKFSLTLFGLAFLLPYAALYVHYAVLSAHGVAVAGWMQAAIGVSLVVRTLLGKAQAVFFTPQVNRGGSPEERMRWSDTYQTTFAFLCAAAVLPLLLVPDLVVRLLYSERFLPAAPYVTWFVLGEVLLLFAGTYQGLVVALDWLGFHVAQNLVAQAVLLAAAGLLVGRYGIAGAGAALLGVPVLLYAGSTLFLRWKFGLSPSRRSVLLTAFVLTSLAAAGAVGATLTGLSPHVLAVKLAVYAACLAGLSLFLTRAERERLAGIVRDLRARLPGRLLPGASAAAAPEPPPVVSL